MVDTNVLIAGSIWPRWPYEVLRHAIAGDFQLVLCPLIIREAQRRMAASFPDNAWRFEEILSLSGYQLVPNPTAEQVSAHAGLVRDPADIPIALAAINAEVDCFITQDRDFTDRNETTEELHRRLLILLPGTFLREYMGWDSEALEDIRKRNW